MADPTPPRPGLGNFADRLAAVEADVRRLKTPSGTQRGDVTGTLADTVAYLASLQSYGSTGTASAILNNVVADGTVKWYSLNAAEALKHIIGPIEVPTNNLIVQASVGEASHTPHDGFMQGYVSFAVRDADAKNVVNFGAFTGRTYVNTRIGLGLTTGPIAVKIDPTKFRGPFTIQPYVGVWGQNTGSGQNVSCVFNTPALRVEVVGRTN